MTSKRWLTPSGVLEYLGLPKTWVYLPYKWMSFKDDPLPHVVVRTCHPKSMLIDAVVLDEWLNDRVTDVRVPTTPALMRSLYPRLWIELGYISSMIRKSGLLTTDLPVAGDDGVRERVLSSVCERIVDRIDETEDEEQEAWRNIHSAARLKYQRGTVR